MKLKKIVLEIKGKEVSMSLEEAKALALELGKLTEKEAPVFIPYNRPVWPDSLPTTPIGPPQSPFWYATHTTNGTEFTEINSSTN